MTTAETGFDQTTDAALWAKEFCDRFVVSTAEGVVQDAEGLMIGWFANAIERGRTAGQEGANADRLDNVVGFLWDLLDNVDTADDMAKSDDAAYRRIAHRQQRRRWESGIRTDGYVLDLSDAQAPEGYVPHLGTVGPEVVPAPSIPREG